MVASSIDGWYSDRADQSDGPGDDEHVERQPAWDTHRAVAPLGRVDRSPSRKKSKKSKGRSSKIPPARPELLRLRPIVLAVQKRNPGASHAKLVQLLQAEGFWLSRANVAAILRDPERSTATRAMGQRTKRSAGSTGGSASVHARSKAARRSTQIPRRADETSEARRLPSQQNKTMEAELQRRQELDARRESAKALPNRLPPMRLTLDEPARKPVKAAGWRHVTTVEQVVDTPHSPDETPVPCYACGAVPTRFGTCRCT